MFSKLFWSHIYRFAHTDDYTDKHTCFIRVDSTTKNWENVIAIVSYAKEITLLSKHLLVKIIIHEKKQVTTEASSSGHDLTLLKCWLRLWCLTHWPTQLIFLWQFFRWEDLFGASATQGLALAAAWRWAQGWSALPPPPPRTPHQAAGVLWHHVSVEVSLSIIQGPVTGPSEIHRYSLKWHQAQSGICFLCSWKHTQDSEVKHLLPSELFTDLPMDLSVTSNWQGNKPCGRDTSASQAEDTEPEKDFLCCW